MKSIYKICTRWDAPAISIARDLGDFDGSSKLKDLANQPLRADVLPTTTRRSFFRLTPGVLVLPQRDIEECEDMYYVLTGTEQLAATSAVAEFRLFNPVDTLPVGSNHCPADTSRFYRPIFRLSHRNCRDIYCIEGVASVPENEFKLIYERHRFQGLTFEKIWEGD